MRKRLTKTSRRWGLSGGLDGKESPLQCWRQFNLWFRKIPWRRKWHPTPVFLPGESHGQRCLVGYGPCGRRESDMTELRVEDFLREEHSRQRTQRYQSSEVGHVYLRKGNRISLTAADWARPAARTGCTFRDIRMRGQHVNHIVTWATLRILDSRLENGEFGECWGVSRSYV